MTRHKVVKPFNPRTFVVPEGTILTDGNVKIAAQGKQKEISFQLNAEEIKCALRFGQIVQVDATGKAVVSPNSKPAKARRRIEGTDIFEEVTEGTEAASTPVPTPNRPKQPVAA